jgi:hypothetical protein
MARVEAGHQERRGVLEAFGDTEALIAGRPRGVELAQLGPGSREPVERMHGWVDRSSQPLALQIPSEQPHRAREQSHRAVVVADGRPDRAEIHDGADLRGGVADRLRQGDRPAAGLQRAPVVAREPERDRPGAEVDGEPLLVTQPLGQRHRLLHALQEAGALAEREVVGTPEAP